MTVIEKIKTVDKKTEKNRALLKFQFHDQEMLVNMNI